jgi:hypothetical protein
MPFQIFGFSTGVSVALVIGACGLLIAVGFLVYLVTQICCSRPEESPGELESRRGPSGPGNIDGLIPPLFYTHHLEDPLIQADLREAPLTRTLL